jgi:predicted nucleic acid-binding protein
VARHVNCRVRSESRGESAGLFRIIELDEPGVREAISLRQQHRLRLPDAIIWAAARLRDGVLATREARDFPIGDPGIRVSYQI